MAEDLPGYEFHEDISQILAGVSWSEIRKISLFDQLETSEVELNGDDNNLPDTLENSELDLMPAFIGGENFRFTRNEGNANPGQSSRNYPTVRLLEREFTDKDALLLIYPNAALENNSIRTGDYKVVVQMLLTDWLVSGRCVNDNEWLSDGDLKSPHAFARILRRLRAELRFVQPGEAYDAKNWSDPTSFYACLDDLYNDMKACEHLAVRDGEVNVYKETKPYEDCLLSIAEVLQKRQRTSLHL